MFVHSAAPLLWSKRSKEWMRMPRALSLPTLVKLPHLQLELFLLANKITLIGNRQLLVRWTVLRELLLVGENRFDQRPEDPAKKDAWRIEVASSHVERRGTVRHHLRHIHLPPLPLRRRLQRADSRNHFLARFSLE